MTEKNSPIPVHSLPPLPLEALSEMLPQNLPSMGLEEIRIRLNDLKACSSNLKQFKLQGLISPTEEDQARAASKAGHSIQLYFCCPEDIDTRIQEVRNNRIKALALFSTPSSVADFSQIKDLAENYLLEDAEILSKIFEKWAKTKSIEMFLELICGVKNEMPSVWAFLKTHPEILRPTVCFFCEQPAAAFLQLIEFCKNEIPESMHLFQENRLLSIYYLSWGNFLDLNVRLKVLELLEVELDPFLEHLLLVIGVSIRGFDKIRSDVFERLYPVLVELVENYPFKNSEQTLRRFGKFHAEAILYEYNNNFLPQVECFIKHFEGHPGVMEGFFEPLLYENWRERQEVFSRFEAISKGLNVDTSKTFLNNILRFGLSGKCVNLHCVKTYLSFLCGQEGFTQESVSFLLQEAVVNGILNHAKLGQLDVAMTIKDEFSGSRLLPWKRKFKIQLTADSCQYGIKLTALINDLLLIGKDEEARRMFETLGKGIKGLEFPEKPQLSMGHPYRV